MKKRMRFFLSVLCLALLLISIVPAVAGATEASATPAPTAAADAAATDAAAGGAVTYSGEYHAYMGIQTDTNLWIFRNAYDDATYGNGTENFKGLSSVKGTDSTFYDGTFTDAVIDGDGTYSVKLENPDFQMETHLSLLFVSTDIPLSDQVKITDVNAKFDGSTKYTFPEAAVNPESKTYFNFGLLNNWNADLKDLFFYPMPPKTVEITFTITGLGYESASQAAAAAATPTAAPTADTASTDTAAATDNAASSDAAETAAPAADDADGGLSPVVIGGIAAGAVVIILAVVLVLAKKKKK
jgi:hypothetical protein